MDHKKAVEVLLNLLKRKKMTKDEKEAISAAVGILDLVSRAKNRILAKKIKKEKDAEW